MRYVKYFIQIIFIVFLTRLFFLITIRSSSMYPTLKDGDKVLLLRYWPAFLLKKGQLVVITRPASTLPDEKNFKLLSKNPFLIKRVVALAGEEFTVYPEDLHPQLAKELYSLEPNFKKTWYIPPKHFFVCGDNKLASSDSRVWGPIPYKNLVGLVVMKLS